MANRSKLLRSAELPAVVLFNRVVAPLIAVVTLFVTTHLYWGRFDEQWLLLATIAFLISSQAFAELNLLRLSDRRRLGVDIRKLVIAWGIVVGILLFLGYATKMSAVFSRRVLLTWMLSMTSGGNWSSSTARLSSSAVGRRTPFICELT